MTKEAPLFANFDPAPETSGNYTHEIFAKVFLPFSDLHWLNRNRLERLREAFLSGEKTFLDPDQDITWLEEDETGNPMFGNIQGEIWWAINFTLPLARLHDVKQISLLAYSSEGERNYYPVTTTEFPQTRMNHSLLVTRGLESVLRTNGFSPEEVNLGIMAGLVHDLATPALGDATKEIDPEALSEEWALERLLEKYDLSALARFGIEEGKVLAIVRGEGTVGQLLDIVDKIVYTAVDIYSYAGDPFRDMDFGLLNQTIEPIRKLLREDPLWANIYQEIKLEDGQVYFADPQHLGRFLELRARMHQALYLNPHCRGREVIFRMLMQPLYSREPDSNHPFNRENLVLYTDREVEKVLNAHWKILGNNFPLEFVLGVLPDYRVAQDPDSIPDIVKDLEDKGLLPIGAETIRGFDPGTAFLTVDPKDGRIKPYSLVRPEHAQLLRAIVAQCNRTVVYYWPEEDLADETWGGNLKKVVAELVAKARQENNGDIPYYQLPNY